MKNTGMMTPQAIAVTCLFFLWEVELFFSGAAADEEALFDAVADSEGLSVFVEKV